MNASKNKIAKELIKVARELVGGITHNDLSVQQKELAKFTKWLESEYKADVKVRHTPSNYSYISINGHQMVLVRPAVFGFQFMESGYDGNVLENGDPIISFAELKNVFKKHESKWKDVLSMETLDPKQVAEFKNAIKKQVDTVKRVFAGTDMKLDIEEDGTPSADYSLHIKGNYKGEKIILIMEIARHPMARGKGRQYFSVGYRTAEYDLWGKTFDDFMKVLRKSSENYLRKYYDEYINPPDTSREDFIGELEKLGFYEDGTDEYVIRNRSVAYEYGEPPSGEYERDAWYDDRNDEFQEWAGPISRKVEILAKKYGVKIEIYDSAEYGMITVNI